MAACGADASRISNRSAGDAACEGGIVGDDGEDGPQGCVWACPAAADGMVPAGARQIDWIAGDPGAAGCAQAASRKVAGRGIEHSGNPARLRPEGRPGDAATLGRIAEAMLSVRATLQAEYEKLHKAVLAFVREDAVCRRLMTVPGVGRWSCGGGYLQIGGGRSEPHHEVEAVGALFGLTPKKYQSGEKDVTGGITRTGDEMVRTALYEAANVLLSRITRFSKLKRWGMDVAKRRGSKRAKVALARKIGIILHRMWIDGTTYRWAEAKPIAAQA